MTHLLQLAGLLHVGLIAAGLTMPRVVNLPEHLKTLPEFPRRLFWVYYVFIATCLVSFGLVSFFLAGELAAGTPLARAVCGFFCLFWSIRLVAAAFVFDVRPYLTNMALKIGYQATNVVFLFMPIVYGWAAVKGGRI
ncbi:MAG: hypothetical protein LAT83_07725 [Kiritimatiellae bacterium]|nr:hypothetical protein [Kiritimatiellia bacterium]